MLHLFLATMDAGHFWSVIAVQMQHLVLYIFFSLLQSRLRSLLTSLNLLLTYVHLHIWMYCDVHTVTAQKLCFLDQQHDVVQQLEQQQQSVQVMSLTCSNAVYWPQVCNLIELVTSNALTGCQACQIIMSARLLVKGSTLVRT